MGLRNHHVFLAAGIVATVVYPFVDLGDHQWVLYDAIGAASVLAVVAGIRRNRPRSPRPWWLIAGGLVLFVAGDIAFTVEVEVLRNPVPVTSIADVFYLLGYVVLALACVDFVRSLREHDGDAVLDTGIIAISGGLVMWTIVAASGSTGSGPLLGRIIVLAYPVCDVILLALVIRLSMARSARSGALWALMCGFGFLVVADIAYAVLQQDASYQVAGILDVAWLLSYVAFGVAGLHPQMGAIGNGEHREPGSLTWRRTTLLAIALLVGPVVMVVHDMDSPDASTMPISLATAALAMLVVWRIARAERERRASEARLAHMALHDDLTLLPNRASLRAKLELAVTGTRREPALVAVIFLDIDGFKDVNDSYGHSVGDQLLVEAADRLRLAARANDTVARFGGGGFVVLAEDVGSQADAQALASRLRGSLSTPFRLAEQDIFASASVGIALSRHPADSAEALLQHADAAMYRAKEGGLGRIEFFDAGMQETITTNLALTSEMHAALEQQEFVLRYQPIVDLRSERFTGCEALIRWQHPERGMLSPDRFVPLAESSGQIVPIGRWVMDTAFSQAATWHAREPGFARFGIAINVSAVQLVRPEFARDVAESIALAGLDPSSVTIEITEGILMRDGDAGLQATRALRDLGVRIALDDFGIGYSSLSYLLRLPIDILKIDASFVRGLGTDLDSSAIVGSVVSLGQSLGLDVIAEGVETEEQLVRLQGIGCPFAQGFFIGRPAPADELAAEADVWDVDRAHRHELMLDGAAART